MNPNISIIPFSKDHIAQTYEWMQDAELRKYFLVREKPTMEKHLAFFDKVLNDRSQKVFSIMFDDQHVGNCGFKNILTDKAEGEIWIYLGSSCMRNKGIGKSASQLLIDKGFNTLGFKLIYLHVAEFNEAAIKLYKSIGFSEVSDELIGQEWKNREYRIIRMELKKD